jgi:catechol 2,3-dioxygenase-like lactoylglutathione lyase family enzyme
MSLAHLTLAIRDVRASLAFFSETLGFRPISKPGNIGQSAAWLEIGPKQELHLVEVADFKPSPFEAEFGRHVALTVSLNEFDALKSRLVRHGATLIEPERPTPFKRFFFRDPNGYVFEIVEADHVSET